MTKIISLCYFMIALIGSFAYLIVSILIAFKRHEYSFLWVAAFSLTCIIILIHTYLKSKRDGTI